MPKYLVLLFSFLTCNTALAINLSSDTTLGGYEIVEALSADGDFNSTFNNKALKHPHHSIWSVDYIYTNAQNNDNNGNIIYDTTTEVDFNLGYEEKKLYEIGGGLTYANTRQENLKEYGPNFYIGHTYNLDEAKSDFTPTWRWKIFLSQSTYLQSFSGDFKSRTGRVFPVSGLSGISQFYPKVQGTVDFSEAWEVKASYTYYLYNRSVPDFLNTLDSPRAVAVGINGLTNAVSGFNLNQTELNVDFSPNDSWEIDLSGTEATSAIDLSASWTEKQEVYYDLSDSWRVGAAFEYEQSSFLTDHLYTLSLKYNEPKD